MVKSLGFYLTFGIMQIQYCSNPFKRVVVFTATLILFFGGKYEN